MSHSVKPIVTVEVCITLLMFEWHKDFWWALLPIYGVASGGLGQVFFLSTPQIALKAIHNPLWVCSLMAIMTHWVHSRCKNITGTGQFVRVLMQTQKFPRLDIVSKHVTGSSLSPPMWENTYSSITGWVFKQNIANEIQKTRSFIPFQKENKAAFVFWNRSPSDSALISVKHPLQKTWCHMFDVNGSIRLNLSVHNCVTRES